MANREEQLKQITEQLEQGVAEIFTSEKYTEYLNTMAKFHNYSFNNTLLIAMQKPEATLVAGYQAWQKKFNRQVKRGEKGIQIIAPAPFKEKQEIEKTDPETGEIVIGKDGQPETEVVERVITKFRVTTVFDVSQTTGEPIPEFEVSELEGDVLIYHDFMESLKMVAPVPIRFIEIDGEAKGFYQLVDKYIAIQPGMSEAQTMKTAVHETAHAVLHDRDQMEAEGIVKDQLTREVEAESVAYVVCNHFGLDTSEYSFSYIASWSSGKNMKELRASMDTIRKTSADMIGQIEEKLKELQIERAEQEADATTLDNLFERFNIERPNDFTGHSMSVSDVIIMNRGGRLTAYYVDSFGFTELPDFVAQRTEMLNANPVKAYPEVYMGTLEKAMQERNVDAYLDSRKLNIDCKNAIEQAITENFDGMSLNPDTATGVVEKYGEERVAFVLANTLKQLSYDGRFSDGNKRWADGIDIPENISRGMDLNRDYIVSSHPAVLNGFIDMARNEIRTRKLEEVLGVKNQHITETTRGYEADGHTGTWYAVDMKTYHGERFFQMRNEEYGQDVADIIVSENGTLVAEDIWHGFDEGAREAISEYLEENGATVYDLMNIPDQATVILADGTVMKIMEQQSISTDTWEPTLTGQNQQGEEQKFSFFEIHKVRENNGIDLKMPENHYIDQYYVIEDLAAKGGMKIERYKDLGAALGAYYSLPNHKMKALGIENTAPLRGSLDFIQCKNGIDTLIYDCQEVEGWLNPQIYNTFKEIGNSLAGHDTEIAYQIGEQYFTIQTVEDGYDYTFYDKDYLELDGGVYDNPDISISEVMENILEEEGLPLEDANVMDYEELYAEIEYAEEERMEKIQFERNCPKTFFDGYDREAALKNYEGITVQFKKSGMYLTVQPTEDGYKYLVYDQKLHEISGDACGNPEDSIQKAMYASLKNEGLEDVECVKVDDREFRDKVISHSKEVLVSGDIRFTSELGRCETALNGMGRAEIEYEVLFHARAVLEEMGLENEVTLIGARVYGSRSRDDLYCEDSDLDVVLSYRGNLREDSFFDKLNSYGMAIAGIKVDINPISEERITLAEYIKESEAYLDQQEIKKLAVDLDNFSYEYDIYEYKDTVENRDEQVEKITEDILHRETAGLKDWLTEVAKESNVDSDVITARSLLSRLENAETYSVFTRQSEQEQTEATITFYVAECMEFPVMGEYHENLTLEEALQIYETIPAERMNGIKGVGFELHDGSDYDGPYDLMRLGKVDREGVEMIRHYKESPLVQKAMDDVEKYFAQKQELTKSTEQTVGDKSVQKENDSQPKSRKESVLQALRERQVKIKEQEQNAAKEKSRTHKKGEVSL